MTACQPCPPAPGPLEGFAAGFDPLFGSLGQRRGFRGYLGGLLAPRDRNKTLTALAGAEPVVQAQGPEVQRLQYFLSEAEWSAEVLDARRLALLQAEPATAAHRGGVLVLDDTGDRKDGTATAHAGRQYLGSVGKTDNGIVAVTTLWTDGRAHYPLHVAPYTPAARFAAGKDDRRFRTKPRIAMALIEQARATDIPFRAVVADCFYGDNTELQGLLTQRKIPMSWPIAAPAGSVGPWPRRPIPLRRRSGTCPAPHGSASNGASGTAMTRPGGRRSWRSCTSARAGRFAPSASPPTGAACRRGRRGTCPRTSGAPRSRRSPNSMRGASGPRTATSASRASSGGRTSRSAATPPSAGTGRWSARRSAPAGGRPRARDA